MSEQAQVGDTVRLSIEGVVYKGDSGKLFVNRWYVNAPNRIVEILSRATQPLPSEPGTWWLDNSDIIWHVTVHGEFYCLPFPNISPEGHAFRQLVLK